MGLGAEHSTARGQCGSGAKPSAIERILIFEPEIAQFADHFNKIDKKKKAVSNFWFQN